MKTLFYLRIVTALLIVLSAGSSFAQRPKAKPLHKVQPDVNTIVTKDALAAFERDYKGAANIGWSKVDNYCHVNFVIDRQKNAVLYDKDGYVIYHIIFGSGRNLARNVADQVNAEYPNCKIQRVFHVFQGHAEAWFIDLEQEKSLIQARVEDGLLLEDYRIRNQALL